MRTAHLIVIVLGASVAAGCSLFRSGGPPAPAPAPAPAPGLATPAACALPGTTADTCVKRQGKWACHIYVGQLPNGSPYVYPDRLKVPPSAGPLKIIWHLQVPNSRFVKDQDGPIWKRASDYATMSNPEFDPGEPTDDPDGDVPSGRDGGKFKVHYKNTPGGEHRYLLQYRVGNTVKACDPHIVSEAG